jgi:MFS family permease
MHSLMSLDLIEGRKPVLLKAVVLFAAASILALSTNMPMLIAGRVLQGTAIGGLMQSAITTISYLLIMH